MKTALQEGEEEPEAGPPGQKRILSPEEKAKKLQKEQTVLAQVRSLPLPLLHLHPTQLTQIHAIPENQRTGRTRSRARENA